MVRKSPVIIGEKNNKLIVIKDLGMINVSNKTKRRFVSVKCECGNIVEMRHDTFKSHRTKSCGCSQYESTMKITIGEKHGRLTIVKDLGIGVLNGSNTQCRNVKCLCECGNEFESQYSNVKYGGTKSCGCLQTETSKKSVKIMIESNTKHGDAIKESEYNRLYNTWCRMKYRCYNVNHEKYKWYGGAGIKVCPEWHDYLTFKNWALNNGYNEELTIDRIDVTKNYEPSNCQWLTAQENIEKEYTIDRETRKRMR